MTDLLLDNHRIFVSHSQKDDVFGIRLVRDLKAELTDDPAAVWYDAEGGLHGGEVWWDKIKGEIQARSIFVVILSPDALDSPWVGDEINIAWARRNRARKEGYERLIVPILYKKCTIPDDLATLQVISFLPPNSYDDALHKLLMAIGAHKGIAAGRGTVPKTSARPNHDKQSMLTTKLIGGVEDAWAKKDWMAVIDKAEYLEKHATGAVPPCIYRIWAEALINEGDYPRACHALDAALALDQFDVPTLQLAARVKKELDQPDAAALLLKDALALTDDHNRTLSPLKDYVFLLSTAEDWAEILRRADQALRLAPGHHWWLNVRFRALLKLNRYDEALSVVGLIAEKGQPTLKHWLAIARLAKQLDRNKTDVVSALEAAAAVAPPGDESVEQVRSELLPDIPYVPEPGDQVVHRLFGEGTVLKVMAGNVSTTVDILFKTARRKTLDLAFAKLERRQKQLR